MLGKKEIIIRFREYFRVLMYFKEFRGTELSYIGRVKMWREKRRGADDVSDRKSLRLLRK